MIKIERMKKMKNENYNEYDSTLDGLIDFLEGLPQASVKMLDLERYTLMLRVAAKLIALLKESTPEGEVNIDIDKKFNLGFISVELENLTVTEPDFFANIISQADNFEIYPLTNGNLHIDITFQGVLKSIC